MTRKQKEAYLAELARNNGRILYRSRYMDENEAALWCIQDRIGTDAKTGTIDELIEWEKGYTQNQSRERVRGFAHPEAKADGCAVRRTHDRHSAAKPRRGRRDGL